MRAFDGGSANKTMSCDCHLEAGSSEQKSVLKKLLLIHGVMFVTELIVGCFADSSGVIADSIDMLADCLAYGVSLCAVGAAHSVKIEAARTRGWFQIVLALSIWAIAFHLEGSVERARRAHISFVQQFEPALRA